MIHICLDWYKTYCKPPNMVYCTYRIKSIRAPHKHLNTFKLLGRPSSWQMLQALFPAAVGPHLNVGVWLFLHAKPRRFRLHLQVMQHVPRCHQQLPGAGPHCQCHREGCAPVLEQRILIPCCELANKLPKIKFEPHIFFLPILSIRRRAATQGMDCLRRCCLNTSIR